jgi:hypothetical protein
MHRPDTRARWLILAWMSLQLLMSGSAVAATQDLGNGFRSHGIASPNSTHRGTVATVDGQGHHVVLAWLADLRGGYELLLIDVDTGKAEEYVLPFPAGDFPYASILSSGNKFYTHFNSHFVEFDPAKRAFTFWRKTTPRMAMSMTEDDNGVIWSVMYPQSAVVSFDPKTRRLTDYGEVHRQSWPQYPASVAADDAGWIYFAIGTVRSQILVFDPRGAKATPVIPEAQRVQGSAQVYRGSDGKVYARPSIGQDDDWYVLYKGRASRIGARERPKGKPIVAGSQDLFHTLFPDGKRVTTFDIVERVLVVEDPKTRTTQTVHFDYTSGGARIVSVAAAPGHTIVGGTLDTRAFTYDPPTDTWERRATYRTWNALARHGDRMFVGAYNRGVLLEWVPSRSWIATEAGRQDSNPLLLAQATPTITQPLRVLAHPNGKTVVLAGTPSYGLTGGGLLFWDRETRTSVVLTDRDVIPEQSTMSLVALPGGKLLGGTAIGSGTGGETKAREAQLYLFDLATMRVEWHKAVLPGIQSYTELYPAPDGLVYGFAERARFFVFDPSQRKIILEHNTNAMFGPNAMLGPTTRQLAPRIFVPGPKGDVYVLFAKGIAKVEPGTFRLTMLAESPVSIDAGGDFLNGRIYFAHRSHLYSYTVPESRNADAGR